MAWNDPPTASNGTTPADAAWHNAYIRDNENALKRRYIHLGRPKLSGVATDSSYGHHAAWSLGSSAASGMAKWTVDLPAEYGTLAEAIVRVVSLETQTVVYSVQAGWGNTGEQANLTTDSIANTALAMTSGRPTDIDISAALTGLASNDQLGLRFVRDGGDASDNFGTGTGFYVLSAVLGYDLAS